MLNEIALLLVEDEPLILMGTQTALEEGGYTVMPASSGAKALAMLEAQHRELSGLITDIRLGSEPDGWALARHAKALNPHMPSYMPLAIAHMSGRRRASLGPRGAKALRGSTNTRMISTASYERRVLADLQERMLDPELVAVYVKEHQEEHARRAKAARRLSSRIERKLSEATTKIERLVAAIVWSW